jgi:hypothetical protein
MAGTELLGPVINNHLLPVALPRGADGRRLRALEGWLVAVLVELFFALVRKVHPFCFTQQLLFDDFYPYYIIIMPALPRVVITPPSI